MLECLTRYQLDTIRVAIEIYNDLPLCKCGAKHAVPADFEDYEVVIMRDARCIMDEFGIQATVIPNRKDGRIEVKGVC